MSEHPKHKFIESDLVNFCGYGMVVVDGYIDDSNGCRESRDHPIHESETAVSEGKEEELSTKPRHLYNEDSRYVLDAGNATMPTIQPQPAGTEPFESDSDLEQRIKEAAEKFIDWPWKWWADKDTPNEFIELCSPSNIKALLAEKDAEIAQLKWAARINSDEWKQYVKSLKARAEQGEGTLRAIDRLCSEEIAIRFGNHANMHKGDERPVFPLYICNCPRRMPYYDWTHNPTCPLYVALPDKSKTGEQDGKAD